MTSVRDRPVGLAKLNLPMTAAKSHGSSVDSAAGFASIFGLGIPHSMLGTALL
jgi:hypothetical protein